MNPSATKHSDVTTMLKDTKDCLQVRSEVCSTGVCVDFNVTRPLAILGILNLGQDAIINRRSSGTW